MSRYLGTQKAGAVRHPDCQLLSNFHSPRAVEWHFKEWLPQPAYLLHRSYFQYGHLAVTFVLAFLPIIAYVTLQSQYLVHFDNLQRSVQPYVADKSFLRAFVGEQIPPRSATPLVVTAFAHWSHYEKIAKVAVALADIGYPITFITGRIFEDNFKKLHPQISFHPIHGKPDKFTDEYYEMIKTFEPGSAELGLFMMMKALIGGIPDQHETLQQVFKNHRAQYGESNLLYPSTIYPSPTTIPSYLELPVSNQTQALVSVAAHSLLTLTTHIPSTWANDQHETWTPKRCITQPTILTKETMPPKNYHFMSALPDYLLPLGVPEFEFMRTNSRPNIHYFGGLKAHHSEPSSVADLPDWWGVVAAAKQEGKKIAALLIPALEAMKERTDVLVIATTVAVEFDALQDLVIRSNARIAKFVPYDVLLPQVDILVNNGGYGAVIQSLQLGVPMVLAGQGEDKNLTNTIVEWKEVGANLGTMRPSIEAVRNGISKVLEDAKYKKNAVAMSKNFDKYDMTTVFDGVIQGAVKKWMKEKSYARRASVEHHGET
ncbi:UDP-Glycosyltransferase/glycogen phosphorylase [Ophiobolus disseminans]|uniref:UDP-Glycosyltransferase/glycogen phosphorylase n=1 Tax=Ophiobolus disseminans TaxID=1469910 RepID=A0A6A7A2W1_9PLEO|nr:UDP-Glycosyltransferase/glycogen phosphorylase [Ophiobolus disseminans]